MTRRLQDDLKWSVCHFGDIVIHCFRWYCYQLFSMGAWTACVWDWSILIQLWAALRCWLSCTISATGTGALCASASREGTGQWHWRLASGGLWYRLQTGRLRVIGWRLWLSEVWMPCSWPLSTWLEWADLGQSHSVWQGSLFWCESGSS